MKNEKYEVSVETTPMHKLVQKKEARTPAITYFEK